jgi:hypothetical protein
MPLKSIRPAHGSFAFSFEDDYTLISFSGIWNAECTDIYDTLLRQRVRSKPDLRRCVIIDGRKWGLETPESGIKKRELNRHLSQYYKALYIAYVLSPDNMNLAKYILDTNNSDYRNVMTWRFYPNFKQAILWLRTEGFALPDLGPDDFPSPIAADDYIKYLKSQ